LTCIIAAPSIERAKSARLKPSDGGVLSMELRYHQRLPVRLEVLMRLRDGSVRKWCRVGAYVLRSAGNGVARR
jgi:hypothetical protein